MLQRLSVCVGPRRSLCRGPATLRRAPALSCFLCRAPAVSVSGPVALCVGCQRFLCGGPALSVSCRGRALLVSGPGALCVGARRSVSGPGALCWAPALSVSGRGALSLSVSGRGALSLSVSGPGALCDWPGALSLSLSLSLSLFFFFFFFFCAETHPPRAQLGLPQVFWASVECRKVRGHVCRIGDYHPLCHVQHDQECAGPSLVGVCILL